MPGKRSPKVRIPKIYDAVLRLEARKAGKTTSAQLRGILKDHFERVYNTQTSGVLHLRSLARLSKQYVATVRLSRVYRAVQAFKVPMKDEKTGRLPGAARRT